MIRRIKWLPDGILVDGAPLNKVEGKLKASLGYLPQDFGLYDELTVTQFLDYMGALKGLRDSRAAIQSAVEEVHLEEKARAKIRTLSGGQRQRVGIAQALLGEPELLIFEDRKIFDEPTVGLDPEERIHFRNLFSRLAQKRLVLLSTHIIEDVQSVCSRLLVLHRGKLRFDGPPEELIRAAEAGLLPFSPAALAEYLRGYRAAGCPPVSHSAAYRAAYHPAYRVGLRSLLPEELRACGI